MSRKSLPLIILFALFSSPTFGQSALGLSVNGRVVVPVGQLEKFVYHPGDARIDARSFFSDIRCAGLPDFPGAGLGFELDQVIKEEGVEPEAKYDISGAEAITFTPESGDISITFADGAAPECTHEIPAVGMIDEADGSSDPGAFWVSDFGPLFEVVYELPESGDGFRIRVKNSSKIMPLRNVSIRFSAPDGASFSVALGSDPILDGSGQWVWTIPLLWPEGAEEDQATLDVLTSDFGAGVAVEDISSQPRESFPSLEPVLVTVVNTSTSR